LGEADVQEGPAFGGEDAGVLGRRELDAVALGELGALNGISTVQEHRTDMLQDILIGLREELRQTLDLDHQTRKALRHAGNPKRGKWGRKGGREAELRTAWRTALRAEWRAELKAG
jgi:hypothetical protein